MPANETSVPRLRPRSRSFRVFPGGTGVSSPASDRMRSELFTFINFRIGRSAKLERRRAPSYYPNAQAEGYRRSSAKTSSIVEAWRYCTAVFAIEHAEDVNFRSELPGS